MIIELRKKSQITLPKEIVKNLNLQEGDKFEVSIENGTIKLEPVAVYPKEYILKLAEEIQVLREDAKFEYNTFNNVDDLLKSLKDDSKEQVMYKLAYTERFKKAFNNLTNNEQIQFQNKMKLFVENVLHPSLRTKKIKGQKDLYESSINMDIRIIWYFENEELIILVDIGHHDILKKF